VTAAGIDLRLAANLAVIDLAEEAAELADAWGLPRTRISAARKQALRDAAERRKCEQRERHLAPTSVAPVKRWEVCCHWGGTRKCPNCKAKSEQHAGNMSIAQGLYDRHKKFVRGRLLAELNLGFVNAKEHPYFADLEQKVWFKVAESVKPSESFGHNRQLLKWLRTVVHSVVVDNAKFVTAQRRDIRREVPLPDTVNDFGMREAAGDHDGQPTGCQAKPTDTAGTFDEEADKATMVEAVAETAVDEVDAMDMSPMNRMRADILASRFRPRWHY
jgi:hypothetical protein